MAYIMRDVKTPFLVFFFLGDSPRIPNMMHMQIVLGNRRHFHFFLGKIALSESRCVNFIRGFKEHALFKSYRGPTPLQELLNIVIWFAASFTFNKWCREQNIRENTMFVYVPCSKFRVSPFYTICICIA